MHREKEEESNSRMAAMKMTKSSRSGRSSSLSRRSSSSQSQPASSTTTTTTTMEKSRNSMLHLILMSFGAVGLLMSHLRHLEDFTTTRILRGTTTTVTTTTINDIVGKSDSSTSTRTPTPTTATSVPAPAPTTIIVTSNLIPSHPSIDIINKTIHSCFQYLIGLPEDVTIMVAIDFPKNSTTTTTTSSSSSSNNNKNSSSGSISHAIDDMQRFDRYIRNLVVEFGPRIQIHTRPTNVGLSWSVYHAMRHVTTEFVYVIQHDMPFIRPVQHAKLVNMFHHYPDEFRVVRFPLGPVKSVGKNIDSCYYYHEEDDDSSTTPPPPTPYVVNNNTYGLKFIKTAIWSDHNQLATRQYYDTIFTYPLTEEKRDVGPMEKTMTFESLLDCETYGPYFYGTDGDPGVIDHLDGRRVNGAYREYRRQWLELLDRVEKERLVRTNSSSYSKNSTTIISPK